MHRIIAFVIPHPKQFFPVANVNKQIVCPSSKNVLGSINKTTGMKNQMNSIKYFFKLFFAFN